MNEWKELDEILEKHKYTYINVWSVMFNRVAPGFLFVSSPWPPNSIGDISLVYLCNDASQFFDRLEIENAKQLDLVKPEALLKLFHAGEVIVVCSTDDDETLEFQFHEGKLMANKEESDMGHEVTEQLVAPGDFIEYTKRHFLLFKDQVMNNGN